MPKNWNKELVNAIADGAGGVIPLPKDFYYVGGTISTGIVISDVENDDLDNSKKGNQFVWIPCTEKQYDEAKDDVIDNEWSCNKEYKDNGSTTGKQTTGGTGDGKAWRDNYTEEDKTEINKSYTGENILPVDEWIANNQIEKGEESIKKYGGFYIARYEAGIPENADGIYTSTRGAYTVEGRGNKDETSKIKELKPISKKGMQAWNYITQPNAKLISEKMYEDNESVESYLVDSQAWNHICKNIFKANNGRNANDSTSWGNYLNNTTTKYEELNCLWAGHKYSSSGWSVANEYKTGGIKEEDYPKGTGEARIELSTGASEDFKKYNIYDMAGNMWEWTTGHNVIEKTDSLKQMFSAARGGSFASYGTGSPVVCASGSIGLTYYDINLGFRVVLYLK